MFAPNNSGTNYICVLPQYASLVVNGSATSSDPQGPLSYLYRPARDPFQETHLTVDKYGIDYLDGAHTPFRSYQCTNPPAGLSARWTLDDWATSAVKDVTTHMPNGAHHGTTNVLGQSGFAALFNGTTDYIEIPSAPFVDVGSTNDPPPLSCQQSGIGCPADFSINAWVKIDTQDANWIGTSGVRVIVEKRTYTLGQYAGYSFYLYNGYLGLQMATSGQVQNFGAPALVVPADGQWHLVTVSVQRIGATVQFLLDGTVFQSDTYNGVLSGSLVNTSPLRIGIFTKIFNAKCYGTCKP